MKSHRESPACPSATSGRLEGLADRRALPWCWRDGYLWALGTLFALFSSMRVLAYLPTIWAVLATGDSSQHSVWTWLIFLGGNVTMAAWLWEQNGRRGNVAILASVGNAVMCTAILAAIAWTRI